MADTEHSPDAEAKKWFLIAILGVALYAGAAFKFVILADVGPKEVPVEAGEHGQHD